MSNDFFNASGAPAQGGQLVSPNMRAEFAAVAAGFDKLPALTGNAYKITYVNASGAAMDVVGGDGLLKLSTAGIPAVAVAGTDYTNLAVLSAASDATPNDTDLLPVVDAGTTRKLSLTSLKGFFKTYFDTLYAKIGLATSSGLTQSTARLLGRTTAGTGAVEEISVGTGLTLSGGALTATVTAGRTAPNFTNSSAMVAQRAANTINLSTSRQIGQCDNIGVWASGGAVSAGTITQITSAISGTTGYAARATGVTLTGSGVISHQICMEAKDAVKYKNNTCSFSVKVDHDVGSNINYTIVVKKPTVADAFGTTSTISTSGATSVATATGTTLTFNGVAMGDCSNGIAVEVRAACGAVTTKNFNCTEFSIDVAATAQTYVAPDFETELARCQRYLPAYAAKASGEYVYTGQAYSGTGASIPIPLKVSARVPPTGISVSNVAHFACTTATTAGNPATTNVTFGSGATEVVLINTTVASGLAQGNATILKSENSGAQILFTGAEL